MAKPPARSSRLFNPSFYSTLLFRALAEEGFIKQRKGSYRMVLKGVDGIKWFSERPDIPFVGTLKPRELLKEWEKHYPTALPKAQATFEFIGREETLTFEMFKPKLKKDMIIFKFEPIINDPRDSLLEDLEEKDMGNVSLFIDKENVTPACDVTGLDLSNASLAGGNLNGANLKNANLTKADLRNTSLQDANLTGANLSDADMTIADLRGANLTGANLRGADLTGPEFSTGAIWFETTCPDGTMNSSLLPCTQEQLNLA